MQLLLLMGPMIPVPVPQPLIDAIESVHVNESTKKSGFQVTFAVSRNSIITTTLIPAGFFDPRTRVVVVAVVNGMPSVLVDGIITRQDVAPSDDPGASTFTITGEDLSLLMDLKHERMCYPAMPHNVRAMLICAKYAMYGIVPAAIPPVITDIPNPVEKIPVQSDTDLAYLKAMASEVGYVFFINSGPVPGVNVAYWGPDVRVGPLQPALTIGMGAATNVESMSFHFDGLSRTQYTLTFTEPTTKIGISVPVPDISLLKPPLAARPAVALREKPLPDVSGRSIPEILLLGLSRTSEASDAITGEAKIDVLRYGSVLKSRQLVGVRGAGLAYDGVYYVDSVTHEIKRGEYKQNCSLTRDGLISLTPAVPV